MVEAFLLARMNDAQAGESRSEGAATFCSSARLMLRMRGDRKAIGKKDGRRGRD